MVKKVSDTFLMTRRNSHHKKDIKKSNSLYNHFSLINLCRPRYPSKRQGFFLQKWQFLIENAQVLFMTKCNFICRYSSFLTYWACKTISQKRVAKIMRFFFLSMCVAVLWRHAASDSHYFKMSYSKISS